MPTYNQDDLRDASEHLADYVVNYTDREIGRDRKFICLNPDHHDTHPSMSIFQNKETGIWKAGCFACHKTYDLADVIGINEGLTEKRDQLARIKDLYGIEIRLEEKGDPTGYKKSRPKQWESQDSKIDSKRIDLTAQAEQAHQNITNVMREAWEKARGITPEVIDRFKLGHFSAGFGELLKDHPELSKGKWESFSIILPDFDSLGVCRYLIAESWENLKFTLAVSQGEEPGIKKPDHKYQVLAGVRKPVWNSKALEGNEPIIAITEGVYDALSFESAGLSAVSILGTEAKQLIEIIERIKPESVFLLALDNDNAGRKAQEDLKRQLERIGARYIEFPLEKIAGRDADINDAWIKNPEGFKAGIREAWEIARKIKAQESREIPTGNQEDLEREIEERERKAREIYAQHTPMRFLAGNYLERKRRESVDPIPTGLSNLDRILEGGLIPGLYTLGAVSSLGKTTLAIQIADHVAQEGHDVLFFSLEMSAEEITDKSLSRCTALASIDMVGSVRYALSLSDLNFPSRFLRFSQDHLECLENGLDLYRSYAGRIYIHEKFGDFTTQDIQAGIQDHQKYTGRKPGLIVVDYLQIIDSQEKHLTPKESLDRTIHALRSLSSLYSVPIIVISSFNRASYDKESSFSNFSGSGQIEYSSDIVIALKYAKSAEENAQLMEDGKAIQIEAQVLKNRKGRKGQTELDFYPRCNFFYERTYRR